VVAMTAMAMLTTALSEAASRRQVSRRRMSRSKRTTSVERSLATFWISAECSARSRWIRWESSWVVHWVRTSDWPPSGRGRDIRPCRLSCDSIAAAGDRSADRSAANFATRSRSATVHAGCPMRDIGASCDVHRRSRRPPCGRVLAARSGVDGIGAGGPFKTKLCSRRCSSFLTGPSVPLRGGARRCDDMPLLDRSGAFTEFSVHFQWNQKPRTSPRSGSHRILVGKSQDVERSAVYSPIRPSITRRADVAGVDHLTGCPRTAGYGSRQAVRRTAGS